MWPKIFSRKKTKNNSVAPTRSLFVRSGGNYITPDSSMQVSAFYSGVIYIATQIAKLPWEIKDKENNIVDSQLATLLRLKPNPEMNSMMFRLFLIIQAICQGNAYAEIERNYEGKIVALWPIPTECVIPMRIEGQLVYRITNGATADDVFLLPRDIFHIRNFFTKDGITGEGLISYAAEVLGIAAGADRMANNLFANNGIPSGVLEVPGTLSEEAMLRIKESWNAAHSGRKTGGTAVLEDGVKYNPISIPPDVLQFLETRKFSVIEIARFLRVPPSKLYSVESSKYSNVEQDNMAVAVDTLDSWARNLEMECDVKLLNNGSKGRKTELNLYAVFRGDMTTRANYFSKMMQSSAITPNEIRKEEGRTPYKEGDRFYIATNNYSPVDRVDEILNSQISSKLGNKDNNKDEVDKAIADYLRKKAR